MVFLSYKIVFLKLHLECRFTEQKNAAETAGMRNEIRAVVYGTNYMSVKIKQMRFSDSAQQVRICIIYV